MPNPGDTDPSNNLAGSKPTGQGDYVVKPGDCMESIAFANGYLWKTLWSLPENAALKKVRDPNILLPGDRVTVPPVRLGQQSRVTDARHKFKLLGTPGKFKLRFLDEKQQPRAGLAYVLTIDGAVSTGSLDSAGSLSVPIRPDAAGGTIQLQTSPEPETYLLDFGHLDPDAAATGIRGRLNNLGYSCASDGGWNAELAGALGRFQAANKLPVTGQLDDPTRQALKQGHLS